MNWNEMQLVRRAHPSIEDGITTSHRARGKLTANFTCVLFSPSLVYWLSPSFFTGNKFSGSRAPAISPFPTPPPSHLGPTRSFVHERGEGTSGEQRDVWEGRRRPTPSRRTSILKCPLPSGSLKLSCRERKRKEKKTDCTVSHTVYSSFVNTCIGSSLACNFHELLRKLLWQVKKRVFCDSCWC